MASNDRSPRAGSGRALTLTAAVLAALLMVGCSVTGPRESPINEVTQGSPTVVEVYRNQAALDYGGERKAAPSARERLKATGAQRAIAGGDGATNRYWSALAPLQQRFARVPNPDLVMVVYPHLAKGKYPVPGYVTVFPMYEQAIYALPGEVAEDANAGHLLEPAARK